MIDILFIWHDQQRFARAFNICKSDKNIVLLGKKLNILRSYEFEPMFVLIAPLRISICYFWLFLSGDVDGRLFFWSKNAGVNGIAVVAAQSAPPRAPKKRCGMDAKLRDELPLGKDRLAAFGWARHAC